MTIAKAQKTVERKDLALSKITLMGHEQVVFCQDA